MSKSSSTLGKVAKSLSAAAARASLVSLLVEITAAPLANAQSMNPGRERMWAIFYKTEIKNPVPGTLGAEMPIMEWYYDVISIRAVGHKRFVETTSCGYRKWKPGQPMTGNIYCRLDKSSRDYDVAGINCKNNSFQVASGFMPSPEWKVIPGNSLYSSLKSQLCEV